MAMLPHEKQASISFLFTVGFAFLFPALVAYRIPELIPAIVCGAFAWVLAMTIKMLFIALQTVKSFTSKGKIGPVCWGTFSGVLELGVVAVFMLTGLVKTDYIVGVAAGVGAGSIEVAYVLIAGLINDWLKPDPKRYRKWLVGAEHSQWVTHMFFIERLSALLIHIGSRGLLGLGLAHGLIFPLTVAILTFSLVDGAATYGSALKWNWYDPRICRKFYLLTLFVGIFDIIILAVQVS